MDPASSGRRSAHNQERRDEIVTQRAAKILLLLFLAMVAIASAETYQDPAGAFSLTPPSGWKLDKDTFVSADGTEALNLQSLDGVLDGKLPAWGDAVIAKERGNWAHLDQRPAVLAGATAIRISGDRSNGSKTHHLLLLLSIQNGKGVVLTFVREAGDQAGIDKLAEDVAATFKWR